MKINNMVGAIAMVAGMIGSTVLTGAAGYAAVAVATTSMDVASAQARSSVSRSYSSRSSSSSRSVFSTPKPAPKPAPVVNNSSRGKAPTAVAPATKQVATPTPAPKPATQSMIGSNVSKPTVTPSRVTRPATRYSSTPPVNRTWYSSPAQRASNGSIVQPLLIGAAAGIGGAMLYDWLTAPSHSVTTTTTTAPSSTQKDVVSAENHDGGLKVVKPTANFKKFEGSEIPEKYQEVMKKQGLTIEPKKGDVTEYSKKIKVKDGVEINVDVAELPVLVVYVNEAGKPSEALFMPI